MSANERPRVPLQFECGYTNSLVVIAVPVLEVLLLAEGVVRSARTAAPRRRGASVRREEDREPLTLEARVLSRGDNSNPAAHRGLEHRAGLALRARAHRSPEALSSNLRSHRNKVVKVFRDLSARADYERADGAIRFEARLDGADRALGCVVVRAVGGSCFRSVLGAELLPTELHRSAPLLDHHRSVVSLGVADALQLLELVVPRRHLP